MVREPFHAFGRRLDVPPDRSLLLLAEALACLAQRLRDRDQAVDGGRLLRLELGGGLVFGLLCHLARRVLGMIDCLSEFVLRLADHP